jgi:hypothetical protein
MASQPGLMDLLERARVLSACALFEKLAPAVVIRLAERARATALAPGERRTTDDTVWIVARGRVEVGRAHAGSGHAVGLVRAVRPAAPAVELVAVEPSALVGLAMLDVRDVLEEDVAAGAALVDRLAALLASEVP